MINRRKFLTLFGIGAVAAPTVAVAVAEDLANVPARVVPAATGGVIKMPQSFVSYDSILLDGEFVISNERIKALFEPSFINGLNR